MAIICMHKITRGPAKGGICTRAAVEGSNRCDRHGKGVDAFQVVESALAAAVVSVRTGGAPTLPSALQADAPEDWARCPSCAARAEMRHFDEACALHSDACPCRVAIEAEEAMQAAERRFARLFEARQARVAITSGLRLAERDRRAAAEVAALAAEREAAREAAQIAERGALARAERAAKTEAAIAAGRALAPAILAAGGDPTEEARRARCEELAADAAARSELEARHGKVWSTDEMQQAFSVQGFAAPFVVVVRKADGKKGSLEFQARPRFYFNFAADGRE